MAQMYATYKDNYNNLQQVALTTTADKDMIYNVMDIGGQFGYYAWFDSIVTNKVVIERFDLTNGTRTTIEAGETITGAKNPIMLCLTRDGNTLYMTCAGQSTIYKYTNIAGTSPTQATSITSVTGAIYAMKINKSGYLTTLSAGDIINQFNTASNDAVVGTANRDMTSTLTTAILGGFYENIPFYFSYEAGTEYIILPLFNTASESRLEIIKINQSSFAVSNAGYCYPDMYNPYSATNPHKYGADIITDVYGDYWLSHTSTNNKTGAHSVTNGTNLVITKYPKNLTNISVEYIGDGRFIWREENISGALISGINGTLGTTLNYNGWQISFDITTLDNVITIGKRDTCEVIKIKKAGATSSTLLTKNSNVTDANRDLNLINNLATDSTGAVYYSYIENLASTEVNGKIYKYRSDGGADTVVPTNVETFLSRTYCLTNRNDMTAFDLSTDGCAGR